MQNSNNQIYSGRQRQQTSVTGITELVIQQVKVADKSGFESHHEQLPRSNTSFGIQQVEVGPMMRGKEVNFINKIARVQAKSSLSQGKENEPQPRTPM